MDKDRDMLLEILGVLSETTKKITEILCRGARPEPTSATSDQPDLFAKVAEQVQVVASVLEEARKPQEEPATNITEALSSPTTAPPAAKEPQQDHPDTDAHPPIRQRGRLTITEEELRKLYIEENLPARIIAERFQVSAAAINQRLRLWGIQKRGTRTPVVEPSVSLVSSIPSVTTQKQDHIEETPADRHRVEEFDKKFVETLELDQVALKEAESAFRQAEASVGGNGKVGDDLHGS